MKIPNNLLGLNFSLRFVLNFVVKQLFQGLCLRIFQFAHYSQDFFEVIFFHVELHRALLYEFLAYCNFFVALDALSDYAV